MKIVDDQPTAEPINNEPVNNAPIAPPARESPTSHRLRRGDHAQILASDLLKGAPTRRGLLGRRARVR